MQMRNNILTILSLVLLTACGSGMEPVKDVEQAYERPQLYPDYIGVTIPVGIAPLDFTVDVPGCERVDAVFVGTEEGELHAQGDVSTCIDPEDWQKLLKQNAGGELYVTVSAKVKGKWIGYQPFGITISADAIDYGITYRLIAPGYEAYTKMGIYETCLGDSKERALIENTQFKGCVNCHSYKGGDPKSMQLHIRGEHGATLIYGEDCKLQLTAFDTKTPETLGTCVYPYWHPSGKYIAYSTNNTRQGFHMGGTKIIEVVDLASDLQVYDIEKNTLLVTDILKQDSIFETFPAFSPDGKTLYFCSARKVEDPKQLRYSLCKIDFDPATGRYGDSITTLIDADTLGQSVTFPRPSYDGRFLCYSMSDYGCFPIWHKESELWMMNLETGESFKLDNANSKDAESYHSWSTNSKWIVFGSRRDDGLFTRPYICHINDDGVADKAFMLPQRDPKGFYGRRFMSYNVPEFITNPVPLDKKHAEKLILDQSRKKMQATKEHNNKGTN